jgi:phospholipase/carboxylesterase
VLPIEQCGRSIAAELRMEGYRVDYREFDGGHIIPEPMMDAGLAALRAL